MMHQEQSELQTGELQATGTSAQTEGFGGGLTRKADPGRATVLPHQGRPPSLSKSALRLWLPGLRSKGIGCDLQNI